MAGIHFAFLIDGKELNPETAESPEQVDMMERIMESITARMEGLNCKEHNEPPKFLCSGENFEELSVEIHGCCEKLVEAAKERMTAP